MSNLSDIGFPTPDEQSINELIMHVLEVARQVDCPRGFYLKHTDPSGAEIYLQGNFNQELVGFNPHFVGSSRRRVRIERAVERDSSELDGGFFARAVSDAGDEEYPFVFDVPDFRTVLIAQYPFDADIQLTAFGSNDFRIFADEAEYDGAQDGETKFASRSFIPVGTFNIAAEDGNEPPPRPIGRFSGEVTAAERRKNEMSGEEFWWMLVETLGGEVDVVIDPRYVPAEPKPGGIVEGTFYLSGRILV